MVISMKVYFRCRQLQYIQRRKPRRWDVGGGQPPRRGCIPGPGKQRMYPQQLSMGARQEENRATAIAKTRPAGALLPVGCGRWTTSPAWMSTGTREAALATRGLQEHELIGDQHEGLLPLPAAAIHPAEETPSVGRGWRTTTPAWMHTGTRETAYVPATTVDGCTAGGE